MSEVKKEEASFHNRPVRKRPGFSPHFEMNDESIPGCMSPMTPNRIDTYRGLYIPIWLLALRLPTEAMLTWAAMARLAGRSRRLRDTTHERIGSVTGLSKDETRRAIQVLEGAGVLSSFQRPGRASEYAFRAPRTDMFSWSRFMRLVDSPTPEPWRPW